MSEISVLEIAVSAKINFENFAKMNPHLPIKQHPTYQLWRLAMEQLGEVIKRLEKE